MPTWLFTLGTDKSELLWHGRSGWGVTGLSPASAPRQNRLCCCCYSGLTGAETEGRRGELGVSSTRGRPSPELHPTAPEEAETLHLGSLLRGTPFSPTESQAYSCLSGATVSCSESWVPGGGRWGTLSVLGVNPPQIRRRSLVTQSGGAGPPQTLRRLAQERRRAWGTRRSSSARLGLCGEATF